MSTIRTDICCCGCSLQEGVSWIANCELAWNVIGVIMCSAYGAISMSYFQSGGRHYRNRFVSKNEIDWTKFYTEHLISVIVMTVLYVIGGMLALMLYSGAAKRSRPICYFWVIGISLVLISNVLNLSMDIFTFNTIPLMSIIPRMYYLYIIFPFINEITQFPKGPPSSRYRNEALSVLGPSYPIQSGPIILTTVPYGFGYNHLGHNQRNAKDAPAAATELGINDAALAGGASENCYY